MQKVNGQNFDEVRDTQEMFRELLDAMSRPGKINSIQKSVSLLQDTAGFAAPLWGIAYTLLDREVTFHVVSSKQNEEIAKAVHWRTFSQSASISEANFIFVQNDLEPKQVNHLLDEVNVGTLEEPHTSATVISLVEAISTTPLENTFKLTLTGPGIKEKNEIYIKGIDAVWIDRRNELNSEFPLGIDMIFITKSGDILAIPRSTKIERE